MSSVALRGEPTACARIEDVKKIVVGVGDTQAAEPAGRPGPCVQIHQHQVFSDGGVDYRSGSWMAPSSVGGWRVAGGGSWVIRGQAAYSRCVALGAVRGMTFICSDFSLPVISTAGQFEVLGWAHLACYMLEKGSLDKLRPLY